MKKPLLLLCIWTLTLFSTVCAQLDSLKALLPEKTGRQLIALQQEIAFQYLFTSPDSSFVFAEKSLEEAKKQSLDSLEAEAHMIIGFGWFVSGNNEEALEAYSAASEKHYQRNDSARAAAALSNIAATYNRMGRLEAALEATLNVLDVLKKGEDQERYGLVLGNAGMMYRQLRRNEEAKVLIVEAKQVLQAHGKPRSLANTLNMLGMVWTDQDSLGLAKEAYLEAKELYAQDDDPMNRSSLYNNLSVLYQDLGITDSAIVYAQLGYELSSELGSAPKRLLNASSLAELNAYLGRMRQAKGWIDTAGRLSEEVDELEPLSKYYRVLSTIQAFEGEFQESYRSSQLSERYRDSILNVEKERALTELEVRYESAKKEQELAQAQLQIERQQQEKERLILGGIFVAILALIAGGIFVYRQRLERQQIILQERIRQQEIKLETTISTQEEERSRLARDLHDGIGQVLSATRLNFGSFEDQVQEQGYRKALNMLDDACREVREVAHVMMPRSLEMEGLAASLQEIIDKSIHTDSLQVELDIIGKPVRLPRSIEINVYRITQELVQNILKHAGATEMNIQLIYRPDRLLLTVEDNGRGLGSKMPESGFGMANIQTRAQAIHGHFLLDNGPERGTIATLRVPLTRKDPTLERR